MLNSVYLSTAFLAIFARYIGEIASSCDEAYALWAKACVVQFWLLVIVKK